MKNILNDLKDFIAEHLLRTPLFDRDSKLFCVKYRYDKNLKWENVHFEDSELAYNFYFKKFEELQGIVWRKYFENLHQKTK